MDPWPDSATVERDDRRRGRSRRRKRWVSPYHQFAVAAGHVTRTEVGECRTAGLVGVERVA